jgi:hypothetical protein
MEYTSYIYAYLDPRKSGEFKFGNYIFEFEPFYIGKGKTTTVYNRMYRHLEFVKNRGFDLTNNQYKYNLIKQILDENLEPIIIKVEENLTEENAFNLEKLLIEIIGTRINLKGSLVNISTGGDGGDIFTNNPRKEEIREMRRQQMSGTGNHRYGIKLEDTPSHKAKEAGHHWNKGLKRSEELKNKWSEQRSGSNNIKAYPIYQYDMNFNLIAEYSYAKECAIKNEFSYKMILSHIKDGKPYKGFYFRKEKIC